MPLSQKYCSFEIDLKDNNMNSLATPTPTGALPSDQLLAARRAPTTEVVLFFLSGVGSSLAWTAILSNLVYYTAVLGKASYIFLNLAVFIPLLPIFIAQARWDSYFDRRLGSLKSFSKRGILGFSSTIALVLLVPFARNSLPLLSILTFAIGTASAVLHGMLKQMASFVYPNCGRLPAALSSGMQASSGFILIVSLITGFGSSGASAGQGIFYCFIAFLVGLCWAAFQVLMSRSKDVVTSMSQRDMSIGAYEKIDDQAKDNRDVLPEEGNVSDEPLLLNFENTDHLDELHETDDLPLAILPNSDIELSYEKLWQKTWPCCVYLMLTVASSMSVASWFNRVMSANPDNMDLPRMLFYTRLFADLFGRPATVLLPSPAISVLGTITVLRLLFVPLFFVYVSGDPRLLPRSDAAVIAGVALFSFSSGYIATACYQSAPECLSDEEKISTPKQTSLMNVCFSASILVGLGLSLGLLVAGV